MFEFVKNNGQWNKEVQFKAVIPNGNLYIKNNKLTYQFYKGEDMDNFQALHHGDKPKLSPNEMILHLHAFDVEFLNANTQHINGKNPTTDYVNYYLGNDKSKWASNVKKYKDIEYSEIYEGINLKFYVKEGFLKYDFVVAPHQNPKKIQLKFNGASKLSITNGRLKIKTSINELTEEKPFAYQLINGKKRDVKCKFHLEKNILSYTFPKGYDKSKELIIDPTLMFASYSGSSIDNWGSTSTFDNAGNLYGGGITFGIGYPTTVGAYQMNFAGGVGTYGADISITKFSPNGSSVIYATYIGGSDNESAQSLIVNNNNELIILGSTSSSDFPTTVGAYQTVFGGGPSFSTSVPNHTSGSDIILAKLNTSGTTLMASTFVGGSDNDGLNISSSLAYNYADNYRGEVNIDMNDNVYVASSTSSNNFPVSAGAFQTVNGGGQDGCVFKLTGDLSTLVWSSYIGGSGNDASYGLQFDLLGNFFVTGGTSSNDFPTTATALNPNQIGGIDGYITKINNTGTTIIASTYLGTTGLEYDQAYFVQTDTANNVYVVGQTTGTYPVQPATTYNNPNSGQFLHKLSPDLSTTIFSTTFGTSSGEIDIALSAFLVNDCNNILISGWGGIVNSSFSSATFSTTNGLPITATAVQSTTDGSDYYLAMFSENAASLVYGTFFGGPNSNDHVDAGTSRFDKRGIVYQAVCSSCGPVDDFPTTPGAYSTNLLSSNCNLGVFKLDLTELTSNAAVYSTPYHCPNDTVKFQNLSNGGTFFKWYFGDGDSSDVFEPHHMYSNPGTYQAMLISIDTLTCTQKDTDFVSIFIGAPPVIITNPVNTICQGDTTQISINTTGTVVWTPNYNIANTTSFITDVWPDTTTTYTVITTDSCGMDTAFITVPVNTRNTTIISDQSICIGESAPLFATGGGTYDWSPSATLNFANINNPIATPSTNTKYFVQITDPNSCIWVDSVTVFVNTTTPKDTAWSDVTICKGEMVQIFSSGGLTYSWNNIATLTNPTDSTPFASPTQTTTYVVAITNGCGTEYDSVTVTVEDIYPSISTDTIICYGDTAHLQAGGGNSYNWNYGTTNSNTIHPQVFKPTTFIVDITNSFGCKAKQSVTVNVFPQPTVSAGADIYTFFGVPIKLNASSSGITFSWTPAEGLSCTDCLNPTVLNSISQTYTLSVVDVNGCKNSDQVTIIYDGDLYVPTSFSPGDDNINDIFYAYGVNIIEFEMFIFDRWGEQLFHTNDLSIGWDGTYKGKLVKTESYIWKVIYKDTLNKSRKKYGKVTLIK